MDLGLTPQESTAYKTALWLGTFAASSLGNILKIPRSTARYTCEALVRKWLMIETKKANTKLFIAENPTKLYSLLYNEEEELKKKKEHLALTIKELQQQYDPDAKIPKITFYEGIDGIERMFDEMLMKDGTLLSFGAGDYYMEKYPDLVKNFRKKSQKQNQKVLIFRGNKYKDLHKNDNRSTHRYFSTIDEFKIDIQIKEDKLSIVSLENSFPIGILIKHQSIVNGFAQIFHELWSKD